MNFVFRKIQALYDRIAIHVYERSAKLGDRWALMSAHMSGTRRRITIVNPEKGDRFAVVATWGKKRISPDAERVAAAAHRRGLNVIISHNGKLDPAYLTSISHMVHATIERPNVGRDFGAYQDAVRFLQQRKSPPKRVVFANDSIFYSSKGLDDLIARLDDDKHAYIGATECFEYFYHIGSFLFSVNNAVFDSKVFRTFWRTYFPFGTRRHMIANGEITLSIMLNQRGGFVPHVLFTAAQLGSRLTNWTPQQMREDFYLMSNLMRARVLEAGLLDIYEEPIMTVEANDRKSNSYASSQQQRARQIALQQLIDNMITTIERGNQIHTAGGMFSRYLGMPIVKKDMAYRDVISMADLIALMQMVEYPDIDYVKKDIRRRGSHASLKGFQRTLYANGYI